MISSSQNSRIKLARSLAGRSRERRDGQAFIAEGVRLVEEALAANWPFRFVFHTDELGARGVTLLERIQERKIQTEDVERRLLASISDTENSQGILAVLDYQPIAVPQAVDFALIRWHQGLKSRHAAAAGCGCEEVCWAGTHAFAPGSCGHGAALLPLKQRTDADQQLATDEMSLYG
jgi:hypothetical protein